MSFKRPPVFTPFLRRFTDERAHDIAETKLLYDRVSAAHQRSVWANARALEKLSDLVATDVGELVELPHDVPLCEAFDNCQKELLALETTIFSPIEVDFSRPLSMKDQVDLNRHMRAVEYFLGHEERIVELLVKTLTNLSAGIMQSVPKFSPSSFSVPLITLIPHPNDIVDKIIGTVSDTELSDVGLFADVQYQIHVNMCELSIRFQP